MGIFDSRDLEVIVASAFVKIARQGTQKRPADARWSSTYLPLAREMIADIVAQGYRIEKDLSTF